MGTRPTFLQTPTVEVDQDKYDALIARQARYNDLMKNKNEQANAQNVIRKTKVEQEDIDNLIKNAEIDVRTMFNKCTLVTVKLENGFILTESSACVNPDNYDEKIGEEICMNKIKDKLWELEGYKLQDKLFKEEN